MTSSSPPTPPSVVAERTKHASRILSTTSFEMRKSILRLMARRLLENEERIAAANTADLNDERASELPQSMYARLKIDTKKLHALADGMLQLCERTQVDPVRKCLSRMELTDGLILSKETVPIGVLLVIFESRPDALPQIASLSVFSGNGLLLKGGSEARHTNTVLHQILTEAITEASNNTVPADVIGLVHTRHDISSLLSLTHLIDLVIPRGSNQLVRHIQESTRIPVLGHADGICHVYLDKECAFEMALRIVIDSKTDYPAACNALETLIVHSSLLDGAEESVCFRIIHALEHMDVECFANAPIPESWVHGRRVQSYSTEFSGMQMNIAVVDTLDAAIEHIHTYGSGHTEAIVTENYDTAEAFVNRVDAACTFHNASTRFADGYRFGLGAEVGISTGKIHARGPVAIDGLLSSKWVLRSSSNAGHTVEHTQQYTHRPV